jgi:plasmid stabilization system protein ParE
MNFSVQILGQASADTEHIYAWLLSRSPQGAATWYIALVETIERIAVAPETFPPASDALPAWRRSIREAFFKTPSGKRYRILFELAHTEIRILRIRGPGNALSNVEIFPWNSVINIMTNAGRP